MKELRKLEEPFRQLLLTPGSMLFSDETTEQVRVYDKRFDSLRATERFSPGNKPDFHKTRQSV